MTLLKTLATAAATLSALAVAVPGAAHASDSDDLSCFTWIHNNDPDYGGVDCTNNSDRPITFHADIVCGWAPDVTGNSVTVDSGQVGESSGHCAFYSTGVGHVGWTIE